MDVVTHGSGHYKCGIWSHIRHGPKRLEIRYRILQRKPHGLRANGHSYP